MLGPGCARPRSPSVSPTHAALLLGGHPGLYRPGRRARCHRRALGAHPLLTLPLPHGPARTDRKRAHPGCCHPSAARCAPDSPAQRLGRVSGRQVSLSEMGFLGAPRCPTFFPGIRLSLPLSSLSVFLAATAAPPPGLRHAAPGPRRRDALGSPLLRCTPAACSPSAGARRLSYRRSHPPGEGSGEP